MPVGAPAPGVPGPSNAPRARTNNDATAASAPTSAPACTLQPACQPMPAATSAGVASIMPIAPAAAPPDTPST